jgi:phospholipid transport system substrate-binding protein
LIETVSNALLADLKANKDKLSQGDVLEHLIEKHVIPATDLEGLARRIVGGYWSELNAEQQQALKTSLGRLIIKSYATALASYKDEEIAIGDAATPPKDHNFVRVNTTIKGSAQTLNVAYYLRKTETGMGIYDINVNGQQFANTYKTSLQGAVQKKDFDALMKNLNNQGE